MRSCVVLVIIVDWCWRNNLMHIWGVLVSVVMLIDWLCPLLRHFVIGKVMIRRLKDVMNLVMFNLWIVNWLILMYIIVIVVHLACFLTIESLVGLFVDRLIKHEFQRLSVVLCQQMLERAGFRAIDCRQDCMLFERNWRNIVCVIVFVVEYTMSVGLSPV